MKNQRVKHLLALLTLLCVLPAGAQKTAEHTTPPPADAATPHETTRPADAATPHETTRPADAALPATAAPSATLPSDSTRAGEVEQLARRVEELERDRTTWQKIARHLPRIGGYAQVGYTWSENTSSIAIRSVRLDLRGDLLREKLGYHVQVEFASPQLIDAYLEYKPFKFLNLTAGQAKVPFTIENTVYGPVNHELIDCAQGVARMMGFAERIGGRTIAATGRDLGLIAWGGFFARDGYHILNYDIGIFNGEGINTADRNKSKDLAVRLTVKPLAGLSLSASCYRGEYGSGYLRRERCSAGISYDRGPVTARGEWIGGRTGRPATETLPAGLLRSSSWYALAGWRPTRSLMTVLRYDTYLEDTSLRTTRQTNYTAGLVWRPIKYLRCQLNYTYEEHAAHADRNVVALLLTGLF